MLPRLVIGFLVLVTSFCTAQLTGTTGPTTPLSTKTKVCNILSYGAKADGATDIGPAILSAFTNCAKAGGATIYIPPGNYAQSTWVTLNGGSHYAFQLDGVIRRTGTAGGHMIIFSGATDLEVFSSTSKGAVQGAGYEMHKGVKGQYGPRIFRFVKCTSFSVHDLALIDSPAFTMIVDKGSNGEVYNLVIRNGDEGGLDAIDISGDNHWIHDIEVTNRDECVTVKSPASNFLIERIYCNQSGGSAIGSLSTGTAISNIVYRNVYTWKSNQMMMIKSNGGSGYVKNVLLENFIGYSNAYSLDIDQYWAGQADGGTSTGVQLSDITIKNWKGTCANGKQRAPINLLCSDAAPCTGLNITDFAIWTDAGTTILNKCRSAHGTGGCLKSGTASYALTSETISTAPAGDKPAHMARDLASGFGLSSEIPVPELPTTYFPGLGLIKPLMKDNGGSNGGDTISSKTTTTKTASPTTSVKVSTSAVATTTTKNTTSVKITTSVKATTSVASSVHTTSVSPTSKTTTTTSASTTASCNKLYAQCGGVGWTGPTCCSSGTCKVSNQYYSQCL